MAEGSANLLKLQPLLTSGSTGASCGPRPRSSLYARVRGWEVWAPAGFRLRHALAHAPGCTAAVKRPTPLLLLLLLMPEPASTAGAGAAVPPPWVMASRNRARSWAVRAMGPARLYSAPGCTSGPAAGGSGSCLGGSKTRMRHGRSSHCSFISFCCSCLACLASLPACTQALNILHTCCRGAIMRHQPWGGPQPQHATEGGWDAQGAPHVCACGKPHLPMLERNCVRRGLRSAMATANAPNAHTCVTDLLQTPRRF